MTNAVDNGARQISVFEPSRRTVVKAAAWAAPVIMMSVQAPLASASAPITSDIVLRFGDIIEGSTRDVSFAVIDFIEGAVRSLGPQKPQAPELVLPPEPPKPWGNIFTNPSGWTQYGIDYAQWGVDVGLANTQYLERVAEYLQELAIYSAWDLAVSAFMDRFRDLAVQSEGLFFASATYPRSIVAVNNGPSAIPAGTTVTVQVTSDINLINAHLPEIGAVQAINTGGTTLLTHTTATEIPVGAVIFSQPLVYNPVAVTLNIAGTVTPSSITAMLSPMSQDTDVNDNGDLVTSTVGVLLEVATGDVQAILGEWQQFIDQAAAFYEIVAPLLPSIDWSEILRGLIPLQR
ncbi:hypothetical protein [Microbacterium sp. YY-01]|uniref:hypothetical protein n=1 Tax=Microbacterium sp. YY-01 TaxID=3421634 RepID=UPI003D186AFC